MNRRTLHGLLGSLVLAGLLVIGLAFTFDGGTDGQVQMDVTFSRSK